MSKQRKAVKVNPYAKALASDLFRKRVVQARKGAGSYKRKERSSKRYD